MSEPDEDASDFEKAPPAKRKISVEFLGNPDNLSPMKAFHIPPPGWLGPADQLTKKFRDQQIALADITRHLAKERDDADERLMSAASAIGAERRAVVEREIRGLELQQQLVDMQQAMLDQQIQQSLDTVRDRRIQYAVLVLAIVGITTTIAVSVAVATHSVWWSLLASGAAFVIEAILAYAIVWGRKPKERTAAE